MNLPSLEDTTRIVKWLAGIAASFALFFVRKKRRLMENESEETPVPILNLRRSEDAGIREAMRAMAQRIDAVERRATEDRNFFLGELRDSENRVTEAVTLGIQNLSSRIDTHNANLNTRLDNLLRK